MALTQIPIELSSTPGIVDNSNATAITIDASENVGIGTSSPTTFSGYLTVHQKNASGDAIHLVETDGGVISQTISTDGGGGKVLIGARSNHPTIFTQNDTEAMRIDSSGNLLVNRSGASGLGKLNVEGGADFTGGDVYICRDSGNLLVGTTNADPAGTTNNVVGTAIGGSGYLSMTRDDAKVAFFNRQTSDGIIADFRKDGSVVGSIGTGSASLGRFSIGSGDTNLFFQPDADYIGPSNATAPRDAAIDLGYSTVRWKDLYLSGGVNFGDAGGSGTSSSNLLDDYEEGTWTPTIKYDTTGVSVSVSRSNYVKIGNMVTVSATVGITSSPSTGSMSIQNLPFSSNVDLETTGSVMLYNVDFDVDTVNVVTYQYNSANKIEVYATKDVSPWYRLNHSNIGNGDSIIFTHTYFTS